MSMSYVLDRGGEITHVVLTRSLGQGYTAHSSKSKCNIIQARTRTVIAIPLMKENAIPASQ